jgi:prepilin-type N-terminal cleavage/methylation domain-containing protein
MKRRGGFTLIEMAISIFILLLIMVLAVPSIRGVLADKRLKRTLEAMNQLVHKAQDHSVHERRPYVIEWQKRAVSLHPAALSEDDPKTPTATLVLEKGYAYILRLPAALEKGPFAQWIFWPSGGCEPATITFKGPPGSWEVNYSPLTGHPQIIKYASQ